MHISSIDDFRRVFDVSRETAERIETYQRALLRWNPKINLVSRSTLKDAWHRHFADSAQVFDLIDAESGLWLDVGSGAGFPGLVVATLAAEKKPDLRVALVESDIRKGVFLRSTAQEMGVSVEIHSERIEKLPPQNADVFSARALASLTQLLEFADRHRRPGGICIFPKGVRADSELTEARESWHISSEVIPSMTDSAASIIKIGTFQRV